MRTLTLQRDPEHPGVVRVVHPDGDVIATCGSSIGSDPPFYGERTAEIVAQAWLDNKAYVTDRPYSEEAGSDGVCDWRWDSQSYQRKTHAQTQTAIQAGRPAVVETTQAKAHEAQDG